MVHVPAYAHTFKFVRIDSYPEVRTKDSTTHWEPLFKVNSSLNAYRVVA